MRKSKIINIDGIGEVMVKEVSPFAAYQAMLAKNKMEELGRLATECISMPEGKDWRALYGSELEQVVDAFLEVNSSFLAILGKLGLRDTMFAMLTELSKTLPPLFADLYSTVVTEKLPGIMAGAAS